MLALVPAAGRGRRKKLEEAARLWARGDLTTEAQHVQQEADAHDSLDEQFAALGIRPEGPVDVSQRLDTFHLWPENLDAWQLFHAVQTQWRVGPGGREGLDYAGVHRVIDQSRAWRLRRHRRFAEMQLMERTSLDVWAEQARKARAQR